MAGALRAAAGVSLRDPASVRLARALGVRRPISLAPDPALALTPPASAVPGQLVVAVRPWASPVPYLPALRAAIGELASEMPVLAVPMQESVDRAPSIEVIDGVPNASVIDPGASLDERLAAIGSARLVIGMRLHSLVAAAAAGVPSLAISYDPKVDAFAALVGQPVVATVGAEIDPGGVVAAARGALAADLVPYRKLVEEMRADLQRSAESAVAALRSGAAKR